MAKACLDLNTADNPLALRGWQRWGRRLRRRLVGVTGTAIGALSLLVGNQSCVTHQIGGNNYGVDREKALSTRVQLTLSYVQQGNWDAARTNLAKAKAISRRDARVFNAEAMVLQMEGELGKAERAFKTAIKRDASFSSARNNYGVFLFAQARYPEALLQFERCAKDLTYPKRAQALLNLGRVAKKMANNAKAKATLEQALRLDRALSPALLLLAQIEFEQAAYTQAKEYLRRFDQLGQPTAASLGLGLLLAREFGHQDQEASLWLALKNRFPYSEEYLVEQRRRKGAAKAASPVLPSP